MKLYNLKSAYSLVETLYGIEVAPGEFEDIALAGWELIGNRHTRLYKYIGDVVDGELKLPCNVDLIESVHLPINDAQLFGPSIDIINSENIAIEGYIEHWGKLRDPFYTSGKLLKYDEGDNTLYFSQNFRNVIVVYHGILVDEEDGLPLINDKEMKAIAAYIAYVSLMKEGIKKRDQAAMSLSQTVQAEWLKKCNAARIPVHLTQNDMNTILNAKTRWDRKQYGKSLKPML